MTNLKENIVSVTPVKNIYLLVPVNTFATQISSGEMGKKNFLFFTLLIPSDIKHLCSITDLSYKYKIPLSFASSLN